MVTEENNADFELDFVRINMLADKGRLEKALQCCEALAERHPEHPRVIHALGLMAYRTGRLDEGERLIRKALELKPDYVDAHYNLGRLLHLSLRNDEAEAVFRAGIALAPEDPKQLFSLASILMHQQHYHEALDICRKVLEIKSDLPEVRGLIGSIKLALGETEDALEYFRSEVQRSSSSTYHSCVLFVLNLVYGASQQDIYQESIAWAKRHTSWLERHSRGHFNSPDPNRRLRIGYVSGDFRRHPVGFHIHLLLASYDKSTTEVFLYDTCPLKEEMTQELATLADHYRSIALMPDDKAESLIRQDCVDILVDLSGHTGMHRLTLFARRPAPVQATWIGYFNTTGVKAIDYFIGDPIATPPEDDSLFTEKVVRLPDNRFCYQAPLYAPEVSSAPVLKNGFITFGSFNGIHKISDKVIATWARVMMAVPGSRFIMKSVYCDEIIMARLTACFEEHGITSDRIEFRGRSTHSEMLAEYGDIDISLDTYPFNGGITTCECLWMGVPVVTMTGATPIARQTAAYLHTIGYSEWIASSIEEYVSIASILASDAILLNKIRTALRQRMALSPLCDGRRFAINLDAAYRKMWRTWCDTHARGLEVVPGNTRRFSVDEIFGAGVACLADGDLDKASQLFRHVIRRRPGYAPAYNNLAVVFKKQGNMDSAVSCFRQAIRNAPGNIDLYKNLGLTFQAAGAFGQARDVFVKASQVVPEDAGVWNALGTQYRFMGHLHKARLAYERSLEIEQDNIDSLGLLAVIWGMYGDNSRSLELLRSALNKDPDNQYLIAVMISSLMYHEGVSQQELYELGKRFDQVISRKISGNYHKVLNQNSEHLRIGFVSPDFGMHPVGMLLCSFFREYDRSRLSLICFNNRVGKPDHLTEWYRSTATAWHDVAGMETEELVSLIEQERIDILVDLSGHTNTNSNGLAVFARRSAPVQVTWLGFGNTTGLAQMDYIIADQDFIRPDECRWFSEKPIYMSSNRFCFTPPDHSPEVVEPPCLDNNFITFGSFNNLVKINDAVVAVWANILKQVPKSKLILKYKSLNEYDVRRFTRERFERFGISPRRIELRPSSNLYFMLAEYADIDIMLDPFPFTGGMTSLYSLWMGVPIITLAGELPISRQTKSFLNLVGLDSLVTYSSDEYAGRAEELANNILMLSEIRESLRQRLLDSPLCDSKRYSSELCNLFFRMWNDVADKS